MKHVVSFSTGLSSALTAERVIQRYGSDSVVIVFMDTTIEDDDNYRFQRDMYQRWRDVEKVTLSDGRTPFQVATAAQLIPNQKAAPCTFRLKIQPFVNWLKTIDQPVTIHIGFDYAEVHRCDATRRNYEAKGYSVDFPLLWEPYELRSYADVCRQDWGIEPPQMYALGYSHANCGGLCVKQGKGDWIRTLVNFPDKFAEIEQWEQQMRDHPVRKKYALLRDQTNGEVNAYTLRQLREDYEAGNAGQLSMLDYWQPCVRCGVGDLI